MYLICRYKKEIAFLLGSDEEKAAGKSNHISETEIDEMERIGNL